MYLNSTMVRFGTAGPHQLHQPVIVEVLGLDMFHQHTRYFTDKAAVLELAGHYVRRYSVLSSHMHLQHLRGASVRRRASTYLQKAISRLASRR